MIDKKRILEILEEKDISYENFEHVPVYTVEEADALDIPFAEFGLKNLFIKDKKGKYFLVSLYGSKRIDLKELRAFLGCAPIHFASEADLQKITGLSAGHVTPFGILNSKGYDVTAVFDTDLQGQKIGIHPMSNDATVFMNFDDLYKLISDEGFTIKMYENVH